MQCFERAGVKLPYSTIGECVSNTCKLVTLLYETLVSETFKSGYLQADAPCPVLDKIKKAPLAAVFIGYTKITLTSSSSLPTSRA